MYAFGNILRNTITIPKYKHSAAVTDRFVLVVINVMTH